MRFLILGLLIIYIIACKKIGDTPITDDLSGNETISGKATVQNIWDGEKNIAFTNDSIFIKKPSNLLDSSFLYGTKSDAYSSFRFSNLNNTTSYIVSAKIIRNTRLDTAILFTGKRQTTATSSALNLIIEPDTITQNAVYVVCTDSLKGALPNDSVYVYTSSILAENDASNVSGTGSSYQFVTKTDGTAFKMKLPVGVKLYIAAAKTFGTTRFKSGIITTQLKTFGVDTVLVSMK